MLKIYSIDQGWCGGTIVIASSQEEAQEKILAARAWLPKDYFENNLLDEHEIVPGLTIDFMGDQ